MKRTSVVVALAAVVLTLGAAAGLNARSRPEGLEARFAPLEVRQEALDIARRHGPSLLTDSTIWSLDRRRSA